MNFFYKCFFFEKKFPRTLCKVQSDFLYQLSKKCRTGLVGQCSLIEMIVFVNFFRSLFVKFWGYKIWPRSELIMRTLKISIVMSEIKCDFFMRGERSHTTKMF